MSELVDWSLDLYGHELERTATVLAAAGHTMDLLTMHANETDAHRMLYTGLNHEQRQIYRQLQQAGILGC